MKLARVRGLATVQDGGRPGHMHEGVPPGGALCPELLAAANRAAGNVWNAPAIEFHGELVLEDGRRFTSAPWRVGYLAVVGGFPAEMVLGGAGTLLVAGLGPPALRAGDEVGEVVQGMIDLAAAPFRILVGPDDFPAATVALLTSVTFVVNAVGDRTGMRLDGPALTPPERAADVVSAPMVRGAIQVPPAGAAIVLGPDHPTTGGYPVVATVCRADLGRLFAQPPGTTVQFVRASLDEARRAWAAHSAILQG